MWWFWGAKETRFSELAILKCDVCMYRKSPLSWILHYLFSLPDSFFLLLAILNSCFLEQVSVSLMSFRKQKSAIFYILFTSSYYHQCLLSVLKPKLRLNVEVVISFLIINSDEGSLTSLNMLVCCHLNKGDEHIQGYLLAILRPRLMVWPGFKPTTSHSAVWHPTDFGSHVLGKRLSSTDDIGQHHQTVG